MPQNDTLLVWDSSEKPLPGDWTIILWDGYADSSGTNMHSIPRLVEENAKDFRTRYLGWIYDLGEARIKGRRLVDHLEIRPGLSYWWMHLLTHKANVFSSPRVVDAIKMMAFESLAKSFSFSRIVLESNDKTLADVFRKWCANKDLSFEWNKLPSTTVSTPLLKKLYKSLPHVFQAFFYLLRYFLRRWPMRKTGIKEISKSSAEISFCNYFLNLDKQTLQGEGFKTGYWTRLHDVLDQKGINSNWLHKFIRHASVPSASHAGRLVNKLNQRTGSVESHTFMDSGLDIRVILRSIRDYFRIVNMGFKLKKHVSLFFHPDNSDIDLWPFFREDWNKSMQGWHAMQACIDLNLSENILKVLPQQRLGFYLQENQHWEVAYIHAWKKAGHGSLIGVPQSTVRFWDLRYFYDFRTYKRKGEYDLPMPDKVALNGPVAVSAYTDSGYPHEKIIEVEALRYLYLEDFKSDQSHETPRSKKHLRVLVLGDYSPHETRQQMEMLYQAAPLLPTGISLLCKPHPACPIDPRDYPGLSLQMTNEPLGQLLHEFDLAYTSSTTSAAVDAWCAGVSVVSVLNGGTLNMSPLRGLIGVRYVAGPDDLIEALNNPGKECSRNADNYFYLDKNLQRWKQLLDEH